jgi:hypothetical protein
VESNRSSVAFVAAFLIFGLAACGDRYSKPSVTHGPQIELFPVAIDKRNPERNEFDHLRLLGAFQLSSRDPRFGGLSGLAIGADGNLYSVSDRGFWLSARMHSNSAGRLLDLTDWQIAPLLMPNGTPVNNKMTDAEGLARAPDGSFIVAFEQVHRLWRYRAPPQTLSSPAVPVSIPNELLRASRNGGLEAVSILPDHRMLVIAEELRNANKTAKAWLIDAGNSAELSYYPERDFAVSDAVALNGGDVLVLERRFSFPARFSARLTRIKGQQIRPGTALKGKELLRLEAPLHCENFEGVAAIESAAGTMIFLISDDNYFPLQRTLLLQFFLPNPEHTLD